MTSQQSAWNHPAEYSPLTTSAPLCSSQTNTFNSQASNRLCSDQNLISIKTDAQSIGDKKTNQRPAKLCQLLTQNTSPDQSIVKSELSRDESGLGENSKSCLKSPSSSVDQSPQPGPGQSPQEKPQSTSGNDEMDHLGNGGVNATTPADMKRPDFILKKLLSMGEEDPCSKRHDSDGIHSPNDNCAMEVDKNEAEPKKSVNNDELLKVGIILCL